jgi:hypothetical protein|tara:strand:+ start:49 stop:321 length:273 start_codon:yes stop_codon:yes gene_type:complete
MSLGTNSNFIPTIYAGTTKKNKMDKPLDKDLQKAEKKKEEALANNPTVLKQIKIGLDYRKDQGLAVLKDKSKKILSKGKNKFYGITNLLK